MFAFLSEPIYCLLSEGSLVVCDVSMNRTPRLFSRLADHVVIRLSKMALWHLVSLDVRKDVFFSHGSACRDLIGVCPKLLGPIDNAEVVPARWRTSGVSCSREGNAHEGDSDEQNGSDRYYYLLHLSGERLNEPRGTDAYSRLLHVGLDSDVGNPLLFSLTSMLLDEVPRRPL